MKEDNLKLFLDISLNFFEKITGERPEPSEPAIRLGSSDFHDFYGWIEVSGSGRGIVCVSMTSSMADELLQCQGESLKDETMRLDMVGEAASIVASNARQRFGQEFKISLPFTSSSGRIQDSAWPYSRFCLPVRWRGHEGTVILAFEEIEQSQESLS